MILVGVDGGSWSLIDPLLAAGELPSFEAIRRDGVTAELGTVEPVNSPTVWTSIATGRSPAAHGITHFYATRLDVKVPSVWERLAARGLRVGLYDYLLTWPPQPLPGGFSIPGWLRRDASTHPVDVFARAKLSPYAYSVDGLRTPEAFAENCRRELREKPDRFARLLTAFDLDVGAASFYAIDAASHRFWSAAFPDEYDRDERAHPRHASVIFDAVRGVDRALGTIRAVLGPEDTLLVASDHGFRTGDARRIWVAHLDAWLEREGLDPRTEAFTANDGFAFLVIRVHPGPFAAREATVERLREMIEGARGPNGEALYRFHVLDVAERPSGAERGWLTWLDQLGLRAFLWWVDVDLNQPAHAYVIGEPQREALDALWPDGRVVTGGTELPIEDFAHPDDFTGEHDPTGIFLAAGPAIRAKEERLSLSVLDLAPLLFHLAGQPIPDDLEGRLPEQILAPGWLAAHPPREVAAEAMPALPASEPIAPEADEDAVTERLRSLGYVE